MLASVRLLLPLLLLGFLTGCAATHQLTGAQETIDALRTENATLRQRNTDLADSLQFYDDIDSGQYYRAMRTLRDQMARMAYEVSLLRDGGITVATLQADELFEPSTATLRDHGIERLAEIATHIQEAYPDRQLRIEGHADNVPLGGSLQEQYPTNWELSTARASAVARHLIDAHAMPSDRLAVVGYSATRPVASNDSAAGRWLNRRVRIAVLPEPHDYDRPIDIVW